MNKLVVLSVCFLSAVSGNPHKVGEGFSAGPYEDLTPDDKVRRLMCLTEKIEIDINNQVGRPFDHESPYRDPSELKKLFIHYLHELINLLAGQALAEESKSSCIQAVWRCVEHMRSMCDGSFDLRHDSCWNQVKPAAPEALCAATRALILERVSTL